MYKNKLNGIKNCWRSNGRNAKINPHENKPETLNPYTQNYQLNQWPRIVCSG